MLHTGRTRNLLAGVAGVTLALALAVGAGAVPGLGDDSPVRTAAVSPVDDLAASLVARQPGDSAKATFPAPSVAPVPTAPEPAPPAPAVVPATVATPRTTAPPTTKAPAKAAPTTAKPPATVAPVTTLPAPAKVARRTPTPTEVQGVITELKRQVGGLLLLVSPTPAQIDQAGDQICTAFDGGQSFAQVKATGLSMIPASITVAPATADWAVRRAVTLYCPGHAPKLV